MLVFVGLTPHDESLKLQLRILDHAEISGYILEHKNMK